MSQLAGRLALAISIAIFAIFVIASQSREAGEAAGVAMLFAAAFLPIYWIAAFLSWQASRTAALDAAGRRAWQLIALANALLAINNAIFFAHRHLEFLPGQSNLTSVVLQTLWYFAMFGALVRLPKAMNTLLERTTFWLDATTVFVSGLLILLYVFAHTPGDSSAESVFNALTTVGFPALNGAVIFAAIIVILRPAHGVSRAAVGLIAASVALTVVGDLAYGRAAAIGAHRGGAWYEPLYLLAAVVATAAAQVQWERPGIAGTRQYEIASTASSLIPYAAVLGAVLTVILELGDRWSTPLGSLVLGAVVMTGLVMARQLVSRRHVQMLAAQERTRLTQHAALESQLQQAQKLEAIGLLAGGIAHDFNNILTAIRASAEMSASPGTDAHHEDMQSIVRAVEHGSSLTRQLLAFGRRDSVQVQRFDLRDVVHDMDGMLRRVVTGGIVLHIELPANPVTIEMDRGQVEQVLLNLAINARDAMPSGGSLDIRVGTTTIEGGTAVIAAGRYAALVVADTGHGMSPGVMAHIFEPFFTTKPRGSGSGLGLSTVYAIISRAGGTINVTSTPGSGTRFEVVLPLAEAAEVEKGAEAADAAAAEPPRILTGREVVLLVDDETSVRDVVARYLSRNGYVVMQESGAAEALVRLAAPGQRVDLLLTDLTMPGMSGRVLIERARSMNPGLRVICMSGYTDREDKLDGEGVAIGNFIEKPFSLSTLGRLVRATLDMPAA